MGRLFNLNASNYMVRANTDLGLNGSIEASWGCWVNYTSYANTRVIAKEINGLDGQNTFLIQLNAGAQTAGPRNATLAQAPNWTMDDQPPLGMWVRYLFTWKRNTIDTKDGQWYANGVPVSQSFLASGYTGAFVMQEDSSNLYYGIRPVTLLLPFDGALAWVSVWNRQLTPQEVRDDYADARTVTSGLVHQVQLCSDVDLSGFANDMTVMGTLACVSDPPFKATILQEDHTAFPKMVLVA